MTGLPPDGHVHSEWSWDAPYGSMERTCARAVEIGLPSVAFTEHVEYTPYTWPAGVVPADLRGSLDGQGRLVAEPLDVEGYLACLARCRERFPGLRILSGAELSEPHLHAERLATLLDPGAFDRVLGSVHAIRIGDRFLDIPDAYRELPVPDVLRRYLAEVVRMIEASDAFAVLAHIDYPTRYLPDGAEPYDPADYEDEHRAALRALAASGRALELNTTIPLHPRILDWWRDVGGATVTFGSDAHRPDDVARELPSAAAMAEAYGFRPGATPYDVWRRA